MRISVIIPCLNAEQTIGRQLAALARQNWQPEWEVVIVDNGSTDQTRNVIEQFRERLPNLRIVEAHKRRSPGYARNVGVAAARGDVLLHCDADDEVGDNWLAAMGRALETHELVACRMDIDKLNPPWLRLVHANPQPEGAQAPLWYPPHLPHAAGATLGTHRALHERIGGFDETLAYLEDTDFCIRAQLAGATLVSVPEAVVHYRYRDTDWDFTDRDEIIQSAMSFSTSATARKDTATLGAGARISRAGRTCSSDCLTGAQEQGGAAGFGP